MANILIIDDDDNIRELLELYLKNAGFDVLSCADAKSALKTLEKETADLALLDVMLPDIKGFDLCRTIKEKYDLPIIMITARDMLRDKIQGFNSGADDYIIKPFEPEEVIARINARLRKPKVKSAKSTELSIGNVTVDLKTYVVKKKGVPVDLKPKEIQLFHFLLLNRNIVFSRDVLLQKVWNYDIAGDTRTVDVHIKTLRKKLVDEDSDWDIKTIRGVGYKIESI